MLTGKTALVTGASRGIGRAIALELAGRGMHVAVVYAGNEQAARQTQQEIEAMGAKAQCFACDVSDSAAAAALVKQVQETLGPVYALVNNAGITCDKLALQMRDADFDRVLDVNLKGAFYLIRQCYSGFIRQRGGRIVNISSVAALMGNVGQANYSAAKAGLIGLTRSVARELAGRGVTCNAVAPGMIETDMTRAMPEKAQSALLAQIPLGCAGTPRQVAALVGFLCADEAAYITGAVIPVDGGLCM